MGSDAAAKRDYARMVDRLMRENDDEEDAIQAAIRMERRAERAARKSK